MPIEGVAARLVIRMEESRTVPTATSMRDIPVAVLEAERAKLNRALAPRRLSYTHLIAYALAQAVAVHPGMAATYQEIDGRAYRVEPARIGLGIAVDTKLPDGTPFLVVPVIGGVDDLGFAEFVAAYDDLVERARSGRLTADDLAGGTITLTNPGTLGTTASVPRLMAGQGTIVATGAIRRAGGEPLMTVSSTYDHRVIQGAESGRFLRTLDELLQGADSFYEYLAADLGLPERSAPGSGAAASTEAAPRAPALPLGAAGARSATARRGRRGDGARALVPPVRPPGGAPRPARHRAARRSVARPGDVGPDCRGADAHSGVGARRLCARPDARRCPRPSCSARTAARAPSRSSTSPATRSGIGCAVPSSPAPTGRARGSRRSAGCCAG